MFNTCNGKPKDNEEHLSSEFNIEMDVSFDGKMETNKDICVNIFDHNYQPNLIPYEAAALFGIARKKWRQAEEFIDTECGVGFNLFLCRKQLVALLGVCRQTILHCDIQSQKERMILMLLPQVELLEKCMNPIHNYRNSTIIKLLSPCVEKPDSTYQFIHMYFELKWLIFSTKLMCQIDPLNICDSYRNLMKDLIFLAEKYYDRQETTSIFNRKPFSCDCIRQIWILMKNISSGELFLNAISSKFSTNDISSTKFCNVCKDDLKSRDELFSLWILGKLCLLPKLNHELEQVQECGGLAESILTSFLTNNPTFHKEKLWQCLKLLETFTSLWSDSNRIEPYQSLWEYFCKHLNSMNVSIPKNCINFMEIIHRVTSHQDIQDSFEFYLSMLLKYLSSHPQHWPKFRGRIYTRLPLNKLNELNEQGIHHIGLLFLILSKVNFSEMTNKLLELLQHLSSDKKNYGIVWIIHISLICIFIENNESILVPSKPLLELVSQTTENLSCHNHMRHYIEGIYNIMTVSNNLMLNQTILFGSWITRYLQRCPHADACYFLKTIDWTARCVRSKDVWFHWSPVFANIILPTLKTVSASPSSPPYLGSVAAMIMKNMPEMFKQYLTHFTSEAVPPEMAIQFMSTLLENIEVKSINLNDEHIIIRSWIRCSIFSSEFPVELTAKMNALDTLKILHIKSSSDPFISFVMAIKEEMNKLTSSLRLKEMMQICFNTIDESITHFISNSQNESLVMHLYTCMGVLLHHCSGLLYSKMKSNCLLNKLINVLLLPTDILMGKSPHHFVLHALETSWNLFFEGVFQLDYSADPFLERTLRDLIIRYIPHFSPTSSPLLKYLHEPEKFSYIIDKLTVTFLNPAGKCGEENTLKVLRVLLEALGRADNVDIVLLIVQKSLSGILGTILFQSNKDTAIEILKMIILSKWYPQIRHDIKKAIMFVTEKHLAFSANKYFQLASQLIKLMPIDMQELMPAIKQHIIIVEKMRGVGYDKTLRQGLERMEMGLKNENQ